MVAWRRVDSSFIDAVGYLAAPIGTTPGYCWIFVRIGSRCYAYLAPIWAYGLLCAAVATGRSVGRAYNCLLKGHYESIDATEVMA